MERILRLSIVILSVFIFSCKQGKKINEDDPSNSIIHSLAFNDERILLGVAKFIETNHFSDPCSNKLLRELYGLYSYIDTVHVQLINQSGGYDPESGVLMSSSNYNIGLAILKEAKFMDQLEFRISLIENYKEYPYSETVIDNIKTSVRPFYFGFGSKEEDGQYSLENIFSEFNTAKTGLLTTELIYYEMLKSNSDCE